MRRGVKLVPNEKEEKLARDVPWKDRGARIATTPQNPRKKKTTPHKLKCKRECRKKKEKESCAAVAV